jgi:hypothetical protein
MNNALNIIESAPTTHTEEQSVRFNGWTHFHATSDQYQGPKALLIYTSTQMVADFGLVDDKGRAVGRRGHGYARRPWRYHDLLCPRPAYP